MDGHNNNKEKHKPCFSVFILIKTKWFVIPTNNFPWIIIIGMGFISTSTTHHMYRSIDRTTTTKPEIKWFAMRAHGSHIKKRSFDDDLMGSVSSIILHIPF